MPDSIGELQNLTALYLCCNNLKSLPNSIGELQNLTSLDLRDNNLENLPDSINKLIQLKVLYIDSKVKRKNLSKHIKQAISRAELINITGNSWEEL